MGRTIHVVEGELLAQPVQAIVSEWYWDRPRLWVWPPAGVARDVRAVAGTEVYRELSEEEPLEPGEATLTGVGRLERFKGIVHVASRNVWGSAPDESLREGIVNALHLVDSLRFISVAFPVLGITRQRTEQQAYEFLRDVLVVTSTTAAVRIVRDSKRPRDESS